MVNQSLYQALEGARTLKGGVVRVKDQNRIGQPGQLVAVVGDEVIYPDGSVATITSGVGFSMQCDSKPVALVGSHVSGNDRIISSPDNGVRILLEESKWIEGLFDPDYLNEGHSHG